MYRTNATALRWSSDVVSQFGVITGGAAGSADRTLTSPWLVRLSNWPYAVIPGTSSTEANGTGNCPSERAKRKAPMEGGASGGATSGLVRTKAPTSNGPVASGP